MAGQTERAHQFWSASLAGLTAGAVIFAFGSQNLLRYADPSALSLASGALALSMVLHYEGATSKSDRTWAVVGVLAALLTVFAALLAVPIILKATSASEANDRRCLGIEAEMLRSHPRRDDLPDLFQAFGCRPQTDGLLTVPARRASRDAQRPGTPAGASR